MKKILVINTGYRIFGGEDTNIVDELNLLKQSYKIEYLEFKNSDKLNFQDFVSFITSNNKESNKSLQKIINDFKPDVAYVHNTWFKGNLGIFELLKNEGINTIHKIHNFRYDCTKSIKASDHLSGNDTCFKCGLDRNSLGFFNKYYQDSYLKSFFIYIFGRRYYKILLNEYSICCYNVDTPLYKLSSFLFELHRKHNRDKKYDRLLQHTPRSI